MVGESNMNIDSFSDRIVQTFWQRCTTASVFLIVILLLLFFDIIFYCKTHSNKGIAIWNLLPGNMFGENRLSLKQQIGLKILGIIIILGLMCCWVFPTYSDISQQQYTQVYALYVRDDPVSGDSFFSNGHVCIETESDAFVLELPAQWDKEEFPAGSHYGTVWYGEQTKIILSFLPES